MYLNKKIILIAALAMSQSVFSQEIDSKNKSLEESLDEKKAHFEANASDEKKRIYAEGINAVKESGVLESAINVGDKAPDFVLANAEGKEVSLYKELEKGPVVLMWYRGGWCPYCNITMHYMQEHVSEFRELGAELVALTPELPDKSMTTAEKHNLEFEVLSDVHNGVAHKYGVVFKLTPEVAKIYEESFGLSQYNGNEKAELPLAATYVINTNGNVVYSFLHPDYRERANVEDIVKALESIERDQ